MKKWPVFKQRWFSDKEQKETYSYHINIDDIHEFKHQLKESVKDKKRVGEPKMIYVSKDLYNMIYRSPYPGIWR